MACPFRWVRIFYLSNFKEWTFKFVHPIGYIIVYIEDTIKKILKRIFDIAHLTDDEKSIMRYMSIMPLGGIKHNLFEELTGYSAKEVRSLKVSHWIMVNEETMEIRLHPLICSAMLDFDETKLTEEICTEFKRRILAKWNSSPQDTYVRHILSKIQTCMVLRIDFPPIRDFCATESPDVNLFDKLKDEYKDTFGDMNKILIDYSNTIFSENSENSLEAKPLGKYLNIELSEDDE